MQLDFNAYSCLRFQSVVPIRASSSDFQCLTAPILAAFGAFLSAIFARFPRLEILALMIMKTLRANPPSLRRNILYMIVCDSCIVLFGSRFSDFLNSGASAACDPSPVFSNSARMSFSSSSAWHSPPGGRQRA